MTSPKNLYQVIVSEKAVEMLVSHVRFLANVSEEAAEKLMHEFQVSAASLEMIPEREPWLTDPIIPAYKYRKLLLNKRYLLIYQIKDHNVYIDFVVDCRQNYSWLL